MAHVNVFHKKLVPLFLWGLSILFVFIGAVTVQAATYYVATTGNDTNPGTIGAPFQTLAKGLSVLAPDDTLYLRGGTYGDNGGLNVGAVAGGTLGHPKTVSAYSGETVTIAPLNGVFAIRGTQTSSSNWIFDGLILDGVHHIYNANTSINPGWFMASGGHDITFQNGEIKNWWYNGIYIEGDNITIRNNKIHSQRSFTGTAGERWYGVYFHDGNNALFEGNDIYNNPGGGMQLYPGPITNVTVRNNRIHANNNLAANVSRVGGVIVGSVNSPSSNIKLIDNLIYGNGVGSATFAPGIYFYGLSSNHSVLNNTITNNQTYGIFIELAGATNNTIKNNVVFANIGTDIQDNSSGNIYATNLTTTPSFVNAAAFDFHLLAGSAAINTGTPLASVTTDFDGVTRPQGGAYDIGAYEVGTGSSTQPITPPQNLTIK